MIKRQPRFGYEIDATVSICHSLCSVPELSVSVAGMECWFSSLG